MGATTPVMPALNGARGGRAGLRRLPTPNSAHARGSGCAANGKTSPRFLSQAAQGRVGELDNLSLSDGHCVAAGSAVRRSGKVLARADSFLSGSFFLAPPLTTAEMRPTSPPPLPAQWWSSTKRAPLQTALSVGLRSRVI